MASKKTAGATTKRRTPRALVPAPRPSRKKVSAGRAARAVGALAVIGTKIAAEKVKQTVEIGRASCRERVSVLV